MKKIRITLDNFRPFLSKAFAALEKGRDRLRNLRFHSRFLKFRRKLQKYRRQAGALLTLLVILLLDATLFNHLRIFDTKPDIILATLIIFSALFTLKWSVGFAFLGGIFRDSMSTFPFGFNTIICIFLVILAKRISQKFTVENIFIRSAMIFLVILLNNLIIWSILLAMDGTVAMDAFLRIAVTQSVFTLLLALPMYRIFVRLLSAEAARSSPW